MSDPVEEGTEVVEFSPFGDAAFSQLMDTLVSDEDQAPAGEGAAPSDPAAADAGQPAPGAPAAGGDGAAAPAPAAGAGGEPAGAGEPAAAGQPAGVDGGVALPADWTAAADELAPRVAELSNAFEKNAVKGFQTEAFEAVQKDYERYFETLDQHPRMLVGVQVPKIGGEQGEMETLRDTADAREWQDAVQKMLKNEILTRAEKQLDENRGFMDTVHASIEIFTANKDLIPGTKDFNVQLAQEFVEFAKPYEVRVDGKLHGYTIQVQPIIDRLRKSLQAAPAAPAAAPAASGTPAAQQAVSAPVEQPQAGIPSQAPQGGEGGDFSTLFGTIGLPGLKF